MKLDATMGYLARYFRPDDGGDATHQIRALIDNPQELAAWRDAVRARFRPLPWRRTAEAILAAIDSVPSAPAISTPMDDAARPV